MTVVDVEGPIASAQQDAERILRTLPEWFGIEESLLEYVADTARFPTFVSRDQGAVIGFLTLREHFPESWEVHCMAVAAGHHGRGVGSGLLAAGERWLEGTSAQFLQVKTLAALNPDPNYARTRAFYQASGFVPLEVFPDLWSPRNPCLQMVKVLLRHDGT